MNDIIMVASTNVEIPTSLIVFVSVYLCGLWITSFYLGFNRFTDKPHIVVTLSVLWPLFWISVLVVTCRDKLEEIISNDNRVRMKRLVCCVISWIRITLLPLSPFAFGRAVSDWIANRKART